MIWFYTLIANGSILGFGLISSILAARLLGVEDRGLLAAVIYWPHFIAGLTAMGLNESLVIQTSAKGTHKNLRATALALSISLAVVVAAPSALAIPYLLGSDRQPYANFTQAYILLFIPLTFIAQNLLAVEQGELNFKRFNFQRVLQASCYPLLLSILYYLDLLNVRTAAMAVLSGTAIVCVIRILQAREQLSIRPSASLAAKILNESWKIHGVNLATHLNMHLDKMILIPLVSNRQLGLYVVAFAAASVFPQVIVQTFINIMLPNAARNSNGLNAYKVARITLLRLAGLLAIGTLLLLHLMPWLVEAMYGSNYSDAALLSSLLLFAASGAALKKATIYLMRSRGRHSSAAKSEITTASVLLLGAFPAFLWQGVIGICILLAVAHMVGAIVAVRAFWLLGPDEYENPKTRNPTP